MKLEYTTMSDLIYEKFGFPDPYDDYLVSEEELSRSMVMLSSSRVHSYESAGGVMFDWVLQEREEE